LVQQLPHSYLKNGESRREKTLFFIFGDHSKIDYHLRDPIDILENNDLKREIIF